MSDRLGRIYDRENFLDLARSEVKRAQRYGLANARNQIRIAADNEQKADVVGQLLRRHEGEILLDLPNEPPMVKLDEPPGVLEDRLIGTWTGADGALELDPSLGFVLRRSAESTAAGCRGRWWLDGTTVRLEPIANVPPAWSLDVHTDGSAMSLRRDGETMWRRQQ